MYLPNSQQCRCFLCPQRDILGNEGRHVRFNESRFDHVYADVA
jgi:hypothetical protein